MMRSQRERIYKLAQEVWAGLYEVDIPPSSYSCEQQQVMNNTMNDDIVRVVMDLPDLRM